MTEQEDIKKIKKRDFIEIEFTAKNLSNNEVFDTNIIEEAKKLNMNVKDIKPFILCVGEGFVVKGFDEALEGKETDKEYTIKLQPEKAFGKRDKNLIRLIPLKMFLEQKIMPQAGMTLALDNNLVKVVSVSGGRVLVDFNNPIAGKDVEYKFKIKRRIEDLKEKVNALQAFFMGKTFDFYIEEKDKKLIFKDLNLTPILNALAPKFKEILDYTPEILVKKEEKAEEKK
jgi:FKBP-type peptidyl-prolyl cis-trans isomerase 2